MTRDPSAFPAKPSGTSPLSEHVAPVKAEASLCLHHWFEKQADENPEAIAASFRDASISYGELNARANRLAHQLMGLGVGPDSTVGLCLERSVDLVTGILGIFKAGGAYIPLDPAYPPDRLAHMLHQAKPVVVLTRNRLHKLLPESAATKLDIDNPELPNESDQNPQALVGPDNLCYVIFTSGSTGKPKGVMVTHRNVARLFQTIAPQIEFRNNDVWTLFHSCSFGFSVWELMGALLHGAHLVIVPDELRSDPDGLYELLKNRQVTVFSQTPSAFRQLILSDTFADADSELALRAIVFSGEAVLNRDLEEWFRQHGDSGPQLINTYAITETGGQVAFRAYTPEQLAHADAGNIGQALADTPVWIMDAALTPVADGEPGELCVGGPGLSRGYLFDQELSDEKFVVVDIDESGPQRIYRTGDQARRLANGDIEFMGRKDGQVKLRGYRIELGDIEKAIAQHSDVHSSVVVIRSDETDTPRLVAYIVTDGKPLPVSELREHIGERLPDYMVPATYVFLDELPLNPNGKLDRNALPAPGKDRPELASEYVAPESKLEKTLCRLWAETLGIDRVGIHDNFFELGGDSILALKLTNRLRQALKEYIYIVALIEAPTVAELAVYIDANYPAVSDATAAEADQEAAADLPVVVPNFDARHDTFPLTDIQQAYLVGRGSDFALGGVSTHLYIEVDTLGLNLPRLEQAWQRVIDRHPMLRAIVLPDGTQKILPDVPPYEITVHDLTDLNEAAQEKALAELRHAMSHEVIPSDRWPLFELSASKRTGDQIRLHISLDCLITDARSFQIMSAELVSFYEQPNTELPIPELSFRDYVITEHQLRESPFYSNALNYWKQRLKTLPPMPQLPLAKAPESLEQHRFVQRSAELSPADWERFQARAAQAGITPTAALLQCFGETLAAWSRHPRLTLNLTLFNRMPLHPDVDAVVGDFTSLVLVGIDNLENGGFEQRAQQLQKELWQGVDNRFVSGVRVLRELAQMGEKVQPMMPVVFTSTLGVGASGADSSSWHHLGEQVFSVSQTPQVWLDHVASERSGALYYTWDIVEELFPESYLDDLFAAYQDYLQRLATDDNTWNLAWPQLLDSLLPEQQLRMREATNATAAPEPDELLHAGFVQQVQHQPDALAVIANDRSLSYAELDTMSNQVAHRLLELGAETNQLVAVVMQKGWEQVVAVLGILKAGAAYLPIDASMPTERLHYLLDHGQVKTAITQVCQDAAIEWPTHTQRIIVSDDNLADLPRDPLEATTTLSDLAYVIYTSGSTGQPKGVVIDHRGAVNTVVDINQRFRVQSTDRVLALSSLSFDLSVYDVFGVLGAGGALVMPDAAGTRDPAHWAAMVAKHQVTIWNTVPALMDLLTEYAEQQAEPVLDSLRLVMMSGDWIPVRLPERIKALGNQINVISLGGATEASIWSILYPIKSVGDDWTSIPYGKPMLNQSFHVLNDDLAECPTWVPGDLYIGGIGLAKGYWRDDEKTAASFFNHPRTGKRLYKTGDLGRYLPDANIEFLGREDFQVKIQGFRVELGEIESALESHPQIRNAVVTAAGSAQSNKRLVAYIVPDSTEMPDLGELRSYLGDKLPEYMVPSAYQALTALPLTANGKVDRMALPEPETETAAPGAAPVTAQPVGGTHAIAEQVQNILQTKTIDADTNLLQMGATSIEMIRIANALDQQLGFRPRMDDFYREPTINGLARLYQPQTTSNAQPKANVAGDPLLTPEYLLQDIDKILDPDDRNAFKKQLPGIRKFGDEQPCVVLPQDNLYSDAHYIARRSYREFDQSPVSLAQLSNILSCLHATLINEQPKYLYGSAGGLYPLQVYLYVKPDRVEGLAGGTYYFHPLDHELILLEENPAEIRELYDPLINRPIFDEAAFGIYLAVDLNAIAPMYRERCLHYSTLEAGHITQLLEIEGPANGIGLCQIGALETERFAELLQLTDQHLLLHALLAGKIDREREDAVQEAATDDVEERDEGEL